MSGGAGYLMTGELIRRVVSAINQGLCDEPKVNYEDVRLGACVRTVNGIFNSTLDNFGRDRFIPYQLNEFWNGTSRNMGSLRGMGSFKKGDKCCSDEAITFHYVSGYEMNAYEYLLYTFRIFNKGGA